MRFGWNEEQSQFADMLGKFIDNQHDFDRRRERLASGDGSAIWQELAELGVMAVPFSPEHGGIGGNLLDCVLVAEALGSGLVIEPWVATVLLGGGLIRRSARASDFGTVIAAVAAGDVRLSLAWTEPGSRHNPFWCEATAVADAQGWRLEGSKSMVFGGDEADQIIVLARTDGEVGDGDGLGLFLVDANAPGLSRRPVRNIDGSGAAELVLQAVSVPATARLDDGSDAPALLLAALDDATVSVCAEMCGALVALNRKTLDYLQQRKAFGQEIAKFQVVQHRLVDMRVAQEQCVAITLKAAQALAEAKPGARRWVHAAKHLVSEEAREIAKHAVQLHGAIGVSDELDISHYFRRIIVLAGALGDADHHLGRFQCAPKVEAA
jgi:alkylation response protein AidB-like acyl-CoA dehydrogenase